MYELALFAGSGGGILGGRLLGWRTVCAVECEGYCRGALAARQNDGALEPFPIWTDVRSFTKRNGACRQFIKWLCRNRDEVVITGGFPCQDISVAGKQTGLDGERSGLWREFARIIGEIRPRHAYIENSPALTRLGLNRVLGDLAGMGFDAEWGVVSASDAIWAYSLAGGGEPVLEHLRERIWVRAARSDAGSNRSEKGVARIRKVSKFGRLCTAASDDDFLDANNGRYGAGEVQFEETSGVQKSIARSDADCANEQTCDGDGMGVEKCETRAFASVCGAVADADGFGYIHSAKESEMEGRRFSIGGNGNRGNEGEHAAPSWWESEPGLGRVAHGVAYRMDRLKAIGNGQFPGVVAGAWGCLSELAGR